LASSDPFQTETVAYPGAWRRDRRGDDRSRRVSCPDGHFQTATSGGDWRMSR